MRGRLNNRGGWRGGSSRGYNFRGTRGNRSDYNNWQNRNDTSNFSTQKWVRKPTRESPGKRLGEEDIGVTEYMSKHEGFNGIIKSRQVLTVKNSRKREGTRCCEIFLQKICIFRYSDFQVAEINEKDEVAKLTDMSPPEPLCEEQVDEDEDLLLSKYNVEILPMETWDRINKLVVGTMEPTEKVEVRPAKKLTKYTQQNLIFIENSITCYVCVCKVSPDRTCILEHFLLQNVLYFCR